MNNFVTMKERRKPADITLTPKQQKGLFIFLLVFLSLGFLVFKSGDIIDYFIDQHVEKIMQPKMESFASEGKPAAIIWMLKHDKNYGQNDDYNSLREAAEKGDPESMYYYGVVMEFRKNKEEAARWYSKAAAEGYPSAVLKQLKG